MSEATRTRGARVLLIEDDAVQLLLARSALEHSGFDVSTAGDGPSGLQAAFRDLPDLIVSDVVMPGLDGYQVCRVLKNDAATRPIPVVLLTALEDRIDRFWAEESGADRFVSKEDLRDRLVPVLEELRENATPRDQARAPREKASGADGIQSRATQVIDRLLREQTLVNRFRRILSQQSDPDRAAAAIGDTLALLFDLDLAVLTLRMQGGAKHYPVATSLDEEEIGRRIAELPTETHSDTAAHDPWFAALEVGDHVPGRLAIWFRRPPGQAAGVALEIAEREIALIACALVESDRRRWLEVQLQQAARQRGIGQLAAGIAHEMNSPAQYLSDNLRFLEEGGRDLLRVAEAAAEATSDPCPERLAALGQALADADVEFLREEFPRAAEQAAEGLDRMAGIIRAMKVFAASDGDERSEVDLNELVEDTLVVSTSAWKEHADVKTDLAPDLPRIHCCRDEIKNVLLNVVVNAAQAVADARRNGGDAGKGIIEVRTEALEEAIRVSVRDDGVGMSEEIRDRVFEPFFTTRDVGQGMGNGLSFAHAVVTRHGGRIWCESAPAAGTTFFIELPQKPAGTEAAP